MILFRKRKRRLVKKKLQIGAISFIFFVTLAILGFHTWLTYWNLSGVDKLVPTVLTRMLLQSVGVTILVMGAFVWFMGVLGTHKLAGPIYRFQETLKQMQSGDISMIIRLRNGDMLMDFQQDLNLALANLREIAAEDRNRVQEALFHLDAVFKANQDEDQREIMKLAIKALQKVGRNFKLSKAEQQQGISGIRKLGPAPGPEGAPGPVAQHPLLPPPSMVPPTAMPSGPAPMPMAAPAAKPAHVSPFYQQTRPFQLPTAPPSVTGMRPVLPTAPPSVTGMRPAHGAAPPALSAQGNVGAMGSFQSAKTMAGLEPPSREKLAAAAAGGEASSRDFASMQTVAEPMKTMTREQAAARLTGERPSAKLDPKQGPKDGKKKA